MTYFSSPSGARPSASTVMTSLGSEYIHRLNNWTINNRRVYYTNIKLQMLNLKSEKVGSLPTSHSLQAVRAHIDAFVQKRRNSIALALELRLSCTNSSICVGTNNGIRRFFFTYSGIILWMHPANERRCYNVTSSLIGCVHSQNNPCVLWPTLAIWSHHHFP